MDRRSPTTTSPQQDLDSLDDLGLNWHETLPVLNNDDLGDCTLLVDELDLGHETASRSLPLTSSEHAELPNVDQSGSTDLNTSDHPDEDQVLNGVWVDPRDGTPWVVGDNLPTPSPGGTYSGQSTPWYPESVQSMYSSQGGADNPRPAQGVLMTNSLGGHSSIQVTSSAQSTLNHDAAQYSSPGAFLPNSTTCAQRQQPGAMNAIELNCEPQPGPSHLEPNSTQSPPAAEQTANRTRRGRRPTDPGLSRTQQNNESSKRYRASKRSANKNLEDQYQQESKVNDELGKEYGCLREMKLYLLEIKDQYGIKIPPGLISEF